MKLACGLVYCVTAILVTTAQTRRWIDSNLSHFVVEEDYSLQLDLLKFFGGSSLSFAVSSVNQTKWTMKDAIKLSGSMDIDFLPTTSPYNVSVIGLDMVNTSVLLVTNGAKNDSENYYVYIFSEKYNDTTKVIDLTAQKKLLPKSFKLSATETCQLYVYSLSVISSEGIYYIDCQTICKGDSSTTVWHDVILENHYTNFTQQEKQYRKRVIDKNLQTPESRKIRMSLISLLSGTLIRESVLVNRTGIIDVMKIADLANESVPFREVYSYKTAERKLQTSQLYSQDIFMGFNNTIVRLSLDIDKLTPIRLKSIDTAITLTSMDMLITEGHVDIHFSYGVTLGIIPKNVKRVRWDNFEYPFFLDNLELYEEAPNVGVSNKMVYFSNKIGLYIRRSTDTSTYAKFPFKGPPDGLHEYTMNFDGATVVILEADKIYMHFLRGSVFLLINQPIDDKLTIVATTQDQRKDVSTAQISTQIWKGTETVLNIADVKDESRFLRETLTTEVLFSKNIPSMWIMGNLAQVSLSCEGIPAGSVNIFSYRNLGMKTLNLGSTDLSSKNTFYYEMDSQLIEGNAAVVLQLELKIYFLKCLLSQSNRMRCRVIKRISEETDMIIEGRIINGEYFMYLTFKGYFIVKITDQNSKIHKIMDSRGTCEFVGYLNYNMITCSNFKEKALELKIIQPDGKVRQLFRKTGVYSTNIQHMNGTQFLFLGNEYTVDILSLRTTNVIYALSTNITKRADCQFKVCGKYLMIFSVGLNSFEQFDISDPYNPVLLQNYTNLTTHNLRMVPGVTTKFEVGCALYWPFLVTDEKNVFALFVNLGAPSKDLMTNLVQISQYSYLSNYFVNAISLMDSKTSPRVIWSFLDTSTAVNGTSFGVEIDVYRDYLMEVKTGDRDTKKDKLPCKFQVKANGGTEPKISVDFDFDLKIDTTKISLEGTTDVSYKERQFELDMFDSVSKINLTNEFDGQSISFYFTTADEDYNKSIVLKQMFNRDDQFTKLIKCSRENTKILDFYTNHRSSFFVLTTEAVYKIKNATNYYVQNYMNFATAASVGSRILCSKLFVNDEANIMINLCEQDKVPLLYVSNWNSLKPGIMKQAYLQEISEISQIRDSFGSENEVYFFTEPRLEHLQLTTRYQKYMLLLNSKNELDIAIVKEVKFPHKFHFVTSFYLDKSKKNLTKSQDVYFMGLIGSNKFSEDTSVCVMKDYDNNELLVIGNFTIKDILGNAYTGYFAPIVNFQCSQIISKSSVECMLVQERNVHYMITIKISSIEGDKWSSTVEIKNIFLNYGNQIPTGPVAFNHRYLTLVSVRPSHIDGTVDSNSANLTKVNLLLYDIPNVPREGLTSGLIKPAKVSAGLPISSVKADTSDMKLRVHSQGNQTYLYLVSKSYYPFQTYRIEPDFMIEVYKNVQSSDFEITSVNHYSSAREKLKIYDKFMRILMIVGGVVLLIIIIVFAWGYFRGKKKRTSTMQNFVANDLEDTDTLSERPTDEVMIPDDLIDDFIGGTKDRVRDTDLAKMMLASSTAGRLENNDIDEMLRNTNPRNSAIKFQSLNAPKERPEISSDESDVDSVASLMDLPNTITLEAALITETPKPPTEENLDSRDLRFASQLNHSEIPKPEEPKNI